MNVIWFASTQQKKAHAFKSVAGQILEASVCAKINLWQCDDLPSEDDAFKCFTCMRLVRKEKTNADK